MKTRYIIGTTLLIAASILFVNAADDSLTIRPAEGTYESQNVTKHFEKKSYIRSATSPQFIRLLIVDPIIDPNSEYINPNSIYNYTEGGLRIPENERGQLSFSAEQLTSTEPSEYSMVAGGGVTKKGKGEGKSPAYTWLFSGKGLSNSTWCSFKTYLDSSSGNSGAIAGGIKVEEGTAYLIKGITDTSVLGLKNGIDATARAYGYRAILEYPKEGVMIIDELSNDSSLGTCAICKNISCRTQSFEFGLKLPHDFEFILYKCLPVWEGYENACQYVQQMWDAYRAQRDWHETQHVDSFIAIIGKIKTQKGEIKYCEITSSGATTPLEFINLKNTLSQKLKDEYDDGIAKFEAEGKIFDTGPGIDPNPYAPLPIQHILLCHRVHAHK